LLHVRPIHSLRIIPYCIFTSLQYMVREHMVEEGMTHHLKSAGHSIIRKSPCLCLCLFLWSIAAVD